MNVWIHVNVTTDHLLDGGGYEIVDNGSSAKLPIWFSKESVLKFCKRTFKGDTPRDLGDRIEFDLPSNGILPARTLAFIKVTIK